MKKLIVFLLCLGILAAPTTVMADVEYSFQLPEGWEGDMQNCHKTSNPTSRLSVSEIDGSLEEIVAMGNDYAGSYITDVADMVTIISLHETSYANNPAATISVFGTVDGAPIVVQNDIISCPDGGLLSFKYYYNDDNRDIFPILDSLTIGSEPAAAAAEPTMGELNAVESAKNYLSLMPFSYTGIIRQLTDFDGYSEEEATYAADNCGADWNEQAAKAAKNYLDLMSFSRQGLIDQLVQFDGFTQEQAEYGVSQNGY